MKKVIRLIMVGVLASATLVGCKKKEDPAPTTILPPASNAVILEGVLTTMTLDATKTYTLKGLVYINSGVTVTIPAGMVIKADKASKASLVVNRGGKLNAVGTADKPIVFTSSAPIPYKNYGDWGGIILCGKAQNNQAADQVIEGPVDFTITSSNGIYGGNVEDDNSGILQYVRLEYGGISYAPDKEINGLTLGSVGTGTTIDHVQVSYSGDDAIEWFGGSVNCKYLVAFRTWDDDFDTDFGYRGNVQFGVSMRDRAVADVSLSNAFESDNDAAGSGKTPYTSAKFSNFTIMGPKVFAQKDISSNYNAGMHIRRNTMISIQNCLVTGFTTNANFDKYQGTVVTNVKNNLFAAWKSNANKNGAVFTAGNGNDSTGFWAANKFGATNTVAAIYKDTILSNGNPIQIAGSAGLTGADFSTLPAFFTSTTYLGAMGTAPDAAWGWNSGWLNFTPENTTY